MQSLLHQMFTASLPYVLLVPAAVLLETVSPLRRYSLKERFPGVLLILLLPIGSTLLSRPVGATWSLFGFKPIIHIAWLPVFVTVPAFLLIRDFLNYWMHRFDHAVLWPIHSLHHSTKELHAANAWAHPLAWCSEFVWLAIPLSFTDIGAQPSVVISCIMMLQAFLIHSPLRVHLGPLRYFFVDHRFHRIHHSIEERHFDKNFGILFSVWDQMFGTAYFPKEGEWPATGVAGVEPPRNPWQFLTHPIRYLNV